MYSIVFCIFFYLFILFVFIRIHAIGGNSFEYGSNLIFVSKNLLKPNSKMHKLFKSANNLWNQHIKQNALMRLISIIMFSISLPLSIVAVVLLVVHNNLYFVFDCITLGILGLNLIVNLTLIIWTCIEGIKANKALNKISNEEYQTFKERILKEYPDFWTQPKK